MAAVSQQTSLAPPATGASPSRQTWSDASLLAILLALTIGVAVGCLYHPSREFLHGSNPFLTTMLTHLWGATPADNRQFVGAYKSVVGAMLLLAIVATLLPGRWAAALRRFGHPAVSWTATGAGVAFLTWAGMNFAGFPAHQIAALVLCGILWAIASTRAGSNRWLPPLVMLILAVCATMPGLFMTTDFSDKRPIDILQMQQHYAMCLGFAGKIAGGIAIPPETSLYYGVLMPTAVGTLEKVIGNLSWGALTHAVQIAQLLLLALIGILLLRFARATREIALIAFLTVVPWYHCNQIGLSFPNQSGLRFLGVFAGILAIDAMGRLPMRVLAPAVGFVAGAAFLFNVETGLTMLVGAVLFLLLMRGRLPRVTALSAFTTAASYLGGVVLALSLYVVWFALITHQLPSFLTPAKLLIYLRAPETLGMTATIAPVALFIFFHAAYVLLRVSLNPPERTTVRDALRGLVALLIVVWELYYFSRPFLSNLAGIWALYSILLVDALRMLRLVAIRKRGMDTRMVILAGGMVAVIFPNCLHGYNEASLSYSQLIGRLWPADARAKTQSTDRRDFSQVLMPEQLAVFLADKCDYIQSLDSDGGLRFVTIYSLLVPQVSGVAQTSPWEDPFFSVNLIKDYQAYLRNLKDSGARRILIDDIDHDPALAGRFWYSNYLAALRQELSGTYYLSGTEHGWQVWTRK